ncbi:MAG: cation diffusion facilitator family transporter, partial [Oscillospiraceae bacterium]
MTEILAKIFIKNYKNVKDGKVRGSYGKLAGVVGIVCNVFLCVTKIIVGLISGSVSITADGLNNLSDASSSIITLLGFKLSEKPADKEHPYGHARIEYLCGLMIAVIILLIGVELVKSSFMKIFNPTPVEFTLTVAAVLVLSIFIKLWMANFNKKLGKKIDSQILLATAIDSRNDVFSTLAVLVAAIITYFTNFSLDGIMGTAVAIFIIISGIGVLKDTVKPIIGEGANEELSRLIAEKVLSYDGVLGVHDLMVHDYGPGRCFASVH